VRQFIQTGTHRMPEPSSAATDLRHEAQSMLEEAEVASDLATAGCLSRGRARRAWRGRGRFLALERKARRARASVLVHRGSNPSEALRMHAWARWCNGRLKVA